MTPTLHTLLCTALVLGDPALPVQTATPPTAKSATDDCLARALKK